MKKTLIFSLLVILTFVISDVYAQHPSVTFFGGANAASMSVEFGGDETVIEESYKTLYGLNIGALYEHVLNKDKSQEIALESGFIFDTKGYHQKPDENQFMDNKTTLYFMDVPLYFKYKYRFRSRDKVYIGAGPYVGVGLFGNSSFSFQHTGAEDLIQGSESIQWGSDFMAGDDYKRLDYGFSGKVGFLFYSGFNVMLSYDYGLANLAVLETKDEKSRIFRISLAYTLLFDD